MFMLSLNTSAAALPPMNSGSNRFSPIASRWYVWSWFWYWSKFTFNYGRFNGDGCRLICDRSVCNGVGSLVQMCPCRVVACSTLFSCFSFGARCWFSPPLGISTELAILIIWHWFAWVSFQPRLTWSFVLVLNGAIVQPLLTVFSTLTLACRHESSQMNEPTTSEVTIIKLIIVIKITNKFPCSRSKCSFVEFWLTIPSLAFWYELRNRTVSVAIPRSQRFPLVSRVLVCFSILILMRTIVLFSRISTLVLDLDPDLESNVTSITSLLQPINR